jgi:hypothetical protein
VTAGWLKHAVLGASTPKMSIIHRLKMNVGGTTPARSMAEVHASDATKPDFCPRHWALMDTLAKTKKNEYLSTALAATFDMGNATADLVKEHWLGDSSIGNWKCKTCGDQRTFCSKPEAGCKKQLGCNWRYVEMVFDSVYSGITGSIDVMVELGSMKVVPTELKIIKVEDFEALKTPLAEHSLRTKLYLKLISDSTSVYKDRINLHEAHVLYVSRGYGKKNLDHNGEILPFKEYVVARDDAAVMPLMHNARQIKIFREDEKHPMPSGICTLPTDKYAKGCSTCGACFSGNYPAAQPALEHL